LQSADQSPYNTESFIMPQAPFQRRQAGFTLIEIAIVLVIIGLLLGGILKGQELINSARVKNLATDFRNIPAFIYGYQDKFRALPGDDANVNNNLTNADLATTPAGAQGNGVIDGTWFSTTNTDESYLFWQHVRLAGLAPGVTDRTLDDYLPRNASGGVIGIQSGTTAAANSPIQAGGVALPGAYIICSTSILGKFVKQLDLQMDDGNTAAGSMMATPTTNPGALNAAATETADIDDAASYTVCMGV
jgi:prepilin-type N-terminal cleavage/methylation domain-containing protein